MVYDAHTYRIPENMEIHQEHGEGEDHSPIVLPKVASAGIFPNFRGLRCMIEYLKIVYNLNIKRNDDG